VTIGRLIVFAKVPEPGRVKTRLSPPLDPVQAAQLYDAMLQDVLESSARWALELDLEPLLAFDPPEGREAMRRLAPAAYQLRPQSGSGLGLRMANAFAESFAAGHPITLLRGSDSPLLERTQVDQMIEFLQEGTDLVLTPDQGGGYVVIGGRNPARKIFEVPMSTRDVLGNTVDAATSLGMRCRLTEPASDVDVIEDLRALDTVLNDRSSDPLPRTVRSIAQLRSQGVL
jgi:rSAM/selenodomain-associated transferase 1